MERDFVTPEQIEAARAVNLLEYIQRTEPGNIVRSAPDEYRLKDHDSLKISNGKFHWFSRGIGGTNAIDYLVKVRGMEFKEAVRELAGGVPSVYKETNNKDKQSSSNKHRHKQPAKPQLPDAARLVILPESDSHNKDVIEYLKGRGIEEKIITDCIEKNLLYQSRAQSCIFVGYDKDSRPKFACERSIRSDHKKDVSGSNKAFSFMLPPTAGNSNRLYVFEGAVDCLSHATIAHIGRTDWDGYRLSLGGVSSLALYAFLENNRHINQVYLCLDNDERGKEATERISNELLAYDDYASISIFIAPPPDGIGKDFNDTLIFMRENIMERKLQTEKTAAIDLREPKDDVDKKRYDAVL